jgi:hypothetical protein
MLWWRTGWWSLYICSWLLIWPPICWSWAHEHMRSWAHGDEQDQKPLRILPAYNYSLQYLGETVRSVTHEQGWPMSFIQYIQFIQLYNLQSYNLYSSYNYTIYSHTVYTVHTIYSHTVYTVHAVLIGM